MDAIFKDQNQLAKKHALEDHWKRFNAQCHHNSSAVTKSLAVDPDELVLTLFLESRADGDGDKEGCETLLAITPTIYTAAGTSSPCVPAIVAMAWFTNAPFATLSQRIDAARRKYGEAMVKLQNALQDPRTAKTDSILFTVLLIRILEVYRLLALSILFLRSIYDLAESWNTDANRDVSCVANIIQAPTGRNDTSQPQRLAEFFERCGQTTFRVHQSRLGKLKQTRFLTEHPKSSQTSLLGWCKIKNLSFSDEIIEANRSYALTCESPTLSARLGNIALEISILRGKLHSTDPTHSKPEYVYNLIQQSHILDQYLIAWRNSVPREWEMFSVIRPEERNPPITGAGSACAPWLDYAASYPDPSKAKWLNHFRCQSIINQSIILHCAHRIARYQPAERSAIDRSMPEDLAKAHSSSTFIKALDTIKTLVDGICASVPYHFDRSPLKGHQGAINPVLSINSLTSTRPADAAPRVPSKNTIVVADLKPPAGAIALVHALIVAHRAPGITADQRGWILNRILAISNHFGVDGSMVEKKLNSPISF